VNFILVAWKVYKTKIFNIEGVPASNQTSNREVPLLPVRCPSLFVWHTQSFNLETLYSVRKWKMPCLRHEKF
jgi:hypothetical protein